MTDTSVSTASTPSRARQWTRRSFLATAGLLGGGLALGLSLSPNRLAMSSAEAARGGAVPLNTWVTLTPDNRVTVLIPHSEMGQGVGTGLAQMLAEEMDADWDLVGIKDAPLDAAYINSDLGRGYIVGEGAAIPGFVYPLLDFTFLQVAGVLVGQMTGGSTAIRLTGHHGMRRAGAAARAMLIQAAAKAWGVPEREIIAQASRLLHAASGRSATFGEMATRAAAFTPDLKPPLKDPALYTIVGQPKKRLDLPGKVDGTATFGIDVTLPGLVHGAIRLPPRVGASVRSIDDRAARALKGVVGVIDLSDAVVVAADSYWTAERAADLLTIEWRGGDVALTLGTIRASQQTALDQGRREALDQAGDPGTAAGGRMTATYGVPYLAHTAMEPMNCTVAITQTGCEAWLGHQNFMFARDALAKALGLSADQVTVHKHLLGGGFGRRSDMDFVINAGKAAKALGRPLKLIYSREADILSDQFRPAVMSRLAGKLDGGRITAFEHLYIDAEAGMPDSERAFDFPYAVANRRIERVKWKSPLPVGAWRAVDFTQLGFFHEAFLDELARAAGADPIAFRLAHLSDARLINALKRLATEAKWGRAKAPGEGRGVALVRSFETIVAMVIDVTVAPDKALKVTHVTTVVDCGRVINPDAGAAQITGSVVFGLTAALHGAITVAEGGVVERNFPDYDMMRLAEAPTQTVVFMEPTGAPGGLGEPGVPPVAPALVNAIADATGERLRELPLIKAGYRSV